MEVVQEQQTTPVVVEPTGNTQLQQTSGTVEQPVEQTQQSTVESVQSNTTKTAAGIKPLIEAAGLVPADVTKSIMEDGEVSPDIMKALVEKHGEGVASLLKDKLEGLYKASVDAATQRDNQVYKQLEESFADVTQQTGKETWTELSTWAKTHIPNEERKEINDLLSKGGIATKLAVRELVERFKTSDQYGQQADLLEGSRTVVDNSSALLTKEAYRTELNKLLDAGHDYNTSPEIRALDRRRAKSQARGI